MFLLVSAYPGSPGQKAVKRLCVCVCVCMSMVITMSPTKTAEPIGVPFMVWTRVGLRNHVLGEGPYPQMKGHLGGHN